MSPRGPTASPLRLLALLVAIPFVAFAQSAPVEDSAQKPEATQSSPRAGASKSPDTASQPEPSAKSAPAETPPSSATAPLGVTDAGTSSDLAAAPLTIDEEARRRRQQEAVELFSDSDPRTLSEDEEPSFGWVAFQTFIALGIVILLVYLTLNYGVRRMMGLRAPVGMSGVRLVDVVERVALDQKRSMYVVKAAGEYLLVGGSDAGLALLSKLDPAEVARLQREHADAPRPQLSPFLQKLLSRRDGTPPKTG